MNEEVIKHRRERIHEEALQVEQEYQQILMQINELQHNAQNKRDTLIALQAQQTLCKQLLFNHDE